MLRWITLILAIAAIQARIFNNPVLDNKDYFDPSAIKANGTYYITRTTSNAPQTDKITIHASTDLINWKPAGYVFDENNSPVWSNTFNPFWAATIQEIRGNYHVYFITNLYQTDTNTIGVAVAPHPLGPYTATDRPLLIDPANYPTIANDNGTLYLIWELYGTIVGRQLNSNGLSFASNLTVELIREDFASTPWYKHRGDYHYIIYSTGSECETESIRVARSRNVLGPYAKLADPILVANNNFQAPQYNSLIKDLDDKSDVIVFQTNNAGEKCYENEGINLASVGWNADNWPYIYDY